MKIDVEGHESAVLAGGRSTLETYHPTILVECEARHRPDNDVNSFCNSLQRLATTVFLPARA